MTNKTKITVITPVYNAANFIRCAVRSLMRQTFGAWELIIVDDGSTDNPKEAVADHLSDPRVTFVRNDKNEGLGYSLNRAMDWKRTI